MMKHVGMAIAVVALSATSAGAASPLAKSSSNKQPIEISSDSLDVHQEQHQAIFTGNVIAVQGTSQMRSNQMIVYYSSGGAEGKEGDSQGIERIEATGNVVFTTPTETAQGDKGIYNVDADTIDLIGNNVTLTRDKNVLKGTRLNYNMTTGRSILTGGVADASGKPGRVHSLFVPKDKPAAGAK